MPGGWVNLHREQQSIPQGQTTSPLKYFLTPTAKARPGQAALAKSAGAQGATHRARPRSPSRIGLGLGSGLGLGLDLGLGLGLGLGFEFGLQLWLSRPTPDERKAQTQAVPDKNSIRWWVGSG